MPENNKITKLDFPEFANEAEEAKWWYDNQDLVGEMFVQAARDGHFDTGRLRRSTA